MITKRIKGISALLLSGLLLAACFCLTACGGDSTDNSSAQSKQSNVSTPAALEIVDSGYYLSKSNYVHYGIGIKNPNDGLMCESPRIDVVGKDASGAILFSDHQTMMEILPGQTLWVGMQAGNGGEPPASVEFSVSTESSNWKESPVEDPDYFEISNANIVKGSFGNESLTGEISTVKECLVNNKPCDDAWITVIFKDTSGQIIGGVNGFVDVGEVGSKETFELHLLSTPSEYASVDVYAYPWH